MAVPQFTNVYAKKAARNNTHMSAMYKPCEYNTAVYSIPEFHDSAFYSRPDLSPRNTYVVSF